MTTYMTLSMLLARLQACLNEGAAPDSPVIVEGYDDDDTLVQSDVVSVTVERRCADDDEPAGVFLNVEDPLS